MPFMCCVPYCKGNYVGGPKVSTFSFPRDIELRRKWMASIKRDFPPTSASKVCQLHFHPDDIERDTSYFKESTGEVLKVPLKMPRLVKGAIPSILPEHPKPSTKKQSLSRIEDILEKFNDSGKLGKWTVVKAPNNICFMYLTEIPHPSVECLVSVNKNMCLSVFHRGVVVKQINNRNFPLKVSTVDNLKQILEEILNFILKKPKERSIANNIYLIEDILDSIVEKLPEKKKFIRILKEQLKLNLMLSNSSWETLLVCSFLHCMSPRAYKFLRSHLDLPRLNTIKKICNNLRINPGFKKIDFNFLQYVSSKFKLFKPNNKSRIK